MPIVIPVERKAAGKKVVVELVPRKEAREVPPEEAEVVKVGEEKDPQEEVEVTRRNEGKEKVAEIEKKIEGKDVNSRIYIFVYKNLFDLKKFFK
jgi:hypothetical protein